MLAAPCFGLFSIKATITALPLQWISADKQIGVVVSTKMQKTISVAVSRIKASDALYFIWRNFNYHTCLNRGLMDTMNSMFSS